MEAINLLFSPNGRVGPREFGRGVILLIGIWLVILIMVTFGPNLLGAMMSLLSMVTIYCYLCIYGKRLHDAGITAWGYVPFLIAFLFLFMFLGGLLITLFAPEGRELLLEWDTLQRRGSIEAAAELQPQVIKSIIVPMVITFLAVNALLAWIAARLRSDPQPNAYGPPT